MSKLTAIVLALSAVSGAPALAQTAASAGVEAASASTLAERLVLCDIADQMSAGAPDRNATRAYVRDDRTNTYQLALPPDYLRPSGWYDADLERAYDRFRRAGLVDRDEVRAARERYQPEPRSRVRALSVAERRFYQNQAGFCRDLVRSSFRS